MTDRFERDDALLRELLERRAAKSHPGGLLAEIIREAGRTPQHGRATWPLGLGGRVAVQLSAAALAVVLVLAGGLALLRPTVGPGPSSTAGPGGSPSPSPAVSPSTDAPVRTITAP